MKVFEGICRSSKGKYLYRHYDYLNGQLKLILLQAIPIQGAI